MATLPNYNNDVIMRTQSPTTQGFTNLDPLTGKPKMLPTTRSSPTNLGSLLGVPGASTAMASGMAVGGIGSPIDGPGGGPSGYGSNPSAITGPSGTNPTPGPNPLPGVDPSGELPSYILNQFGSNIAGALKGELPKDVQDLLAQQSAEYGVASGTQGSQFQGYRGLRNLGLTSLDRMKQAEDLVAGQFTKPADKIALDQSAKKIRDLEDQFNKSFGLDKQKLEAELKLEKDKFAAEQNRLQHDLQLQELQSLGLKYNGLTGGAGGGAYSGIKPGIDYGLSKTSPGQWEPMQFGVTSMI